jgi:outer membrane protein TolC
MPILDGGKKAAQIGMVKTQIEMNKNLRQINENTIKQQIVTLVDDLNLYRHNLNLARQTDSSATRRYELANILYQAGKNTITELNIARAEKDAARKSSFSTLRAFWETFYLLRRVTLYDFLRDTPLN